MARARNLKPSFFSNDILAECEPMARLLFAGLWTLADRDGRLEYRPKRIKGALFPYDNCDIEALIAQLAARGFVQVYQVGGIHVLNIPTFVEHQRCHPDERSEGLPPPPEQGEECVAHGENAKPGNPTHEPGNFPATCASFPFPLSPFPLPLSPCGMTPTETPKRRRSPSADSIRWTPAAGWEGIEPADRQGWAAAYPACDIARELAAAAEWLKANPEKARKSKWRAFVTRWLSRSQDRGGGKASNRPGDAPPAKAWADRPSWRADAGRNMTDSQHRAWLATRHPSQAALAIAGRLSVDRTAQ